MIQKVCITPIARDSYIFSEGVMFEVEYYLEDYEEMMESDSNDDVKARLVEGYEIKKIFSPEEVRKEFKEALERVTEEIADKIESQYYYIYNGLIEYGKSTKESEEEVLDK